jgi:hypothetical protein
VPESPNRRVVDLQEDIYMVVSTGIQNETINHDGDMHFALTDSQSYRR